MATKIVQETFGRKRAEALVRECLGHVPQGEVVMGSAWESRVSRTLPDGFFKLGCIVFCVDLCGSLIHGRGSQFMRVRLNEPKGYSILRTCGRLVLVALMKCPGRQVGGGDMERLCAYEGFGPNDLLAGAILQLRRIFQPSIMGTEIIETVPCVDRTVSDTGWAYRLNPNINACTILRPPRTRIEE